MQALGEQLGVQTMVSSIPYASQPLFLMFMQVVSYISYISPYLKLV